MNARVFSGILVLVLAIATIAGWLLYLPVQGVIILGSALILGFIGWRLTTYNNPVESRNVINLYLLAVALQTVHLGEEVLTGFAPRFSEELVHDPGTWTETEFLATFVSAFVPLWILAAIALSSKIPIVNALGNYFAWFYALGAGLTNAIAHFVFPVVVGGYFPGLYTAPLHLIMSVILIAALIRENNRVREHHLRTEAGK